jgi:hypothetical protein
MLDIKFYNWLQIPLLFYWRSDVLGYVRLERGRSEPGEAAAMAVAPIVVRRQRPLAVDGAPELPAPDHQGILQQSPLLQVHQVRYGRLHPVGEFVCVKCILACIWLSLPLE